MEQVYLPDRGSVHSVTHLTYDPIEQVQPIDSVHSVTHLTLTGRSSHLTNDPIEQIHKLQVYQ